MKKEYGIHENINNRFLFIAIFLIVIFLIITISLFNIVVLNKSKYIKEFKNTNTLTYVGKKGKRGKIFDRNGKLLVGNKEINIIVYNKNSDVSYKKELLIANKLSKIIEIDYKDLSEKEIKEYFYLKNKNYLDSKIDKRIKEKKEKNIINEEEYKNIVYTLIDEERLSLLTEEDKKSAYIYVLMNKGYWYEEKIIKNENITEEEKGVIKSLEKDGVGIGVRYEREYPYGESLEGYFGYLGKVPLEEKEYYLKNEYNLNDIVGVSYLEKEYEEILKASNEIYKITPSGEKEIIKTAKNGNDIMLSIDIDKQIKVENVIYDNVIKAKNEANTSLYNKSFVIVADSNTGEIIVAASIGANKINNTWQKTYHTRDLTNYSVVPGSIVKGASHLVGYETGALSYGYTVTDSCIKLKNLYKRCSYRSLGVIDDLKALKYSSNYYQYLIAIKVGGKEYKYNQSLDINPLVFNIYRKMYNSFGLGVKTGIDLPIEETGYKGSDTYLPSILDFPIGQYDTYTPMQLLQYMMTFASSGVRIAPHFLKSVYKGDTDLEEKVYDYKVNVLGKANANIENINRVQLGLKMVMESGGTGSGYIDLKYNPYGKTGTSETFLDTNNDKVIDTKAITNTFGAYVSNGEKKYTIVVISPSVSNTKTSYTTSVNKKIVKEVSEFCFEN